MEEDGVDGEARYQAFKNWFETVLLNAPGALDDADKDKLQKSNNTYSTWGDLESMMSCPALAVDPDNGTVAMTYYKAQPPVHMNDVQFKDNNIIQKVYATRGTGIIMQNMATPSDISRQCTTGWQMKKIM